MRLRNSLPAAVFLSAALHVSPLDAAPKSDTAQSAGLSLVVKPHAGAEAIDVSGQAAPGGALTITLVSTIDRDVPDVVLSRTTLVTDPDGAFSGTITIAPGFTRGSIITVYATPTGVGPAATARYLPDAPNRGVVIPYDDIPRSVR